MIRGISPRDQSPRFTVHHETVGLRVQVSLVHNAVITCSYACSCSRPNRFRTEGGHAGELELGCERGQRTPGWGAPGYPGPQYGGGGGAPAGRGALARAANFRFGFFLEKFPVLG